MTTALFARVWPAEKLRATATGAVASPGNRRRLPVVGVLTAVTLRASALAVPGIPQRPAATRTRSLNGGTAGPP